MKNLTKALSQNNSYLTCYFFFSLFLFSICIGLSKENGFLFINEFHFNLLDYFFIFFTKIGDGIFVICIIILMLLRKKTGWACQTTISFLVSGIFTQLLKFFFHIPRPKTYFGSNIHVHCIQNITLSGSSSFPSGHTASIFALTTLLSIYYRDRRSSIFFFLIACLTGYSRIYLAQHFPADVLAGSFIGVITSLMVFVLVPLEYLERKFPKTGLMHHSVKLQ